MGPDPWHELCSQWLRELSHFDHIAVYQRPQAARKGLALLLFSDGVPVAFVKCRPDGATLDLERRALDAVHAKTCNTFSAPVPIGHGHGPGWEWLAMSPLPTRPLRSAKRPPLEKIVGEIQESLEPVLDREQAPPGWQPMHGDLTPWNLRQARRQQLFLIDWEDIGWGPPGADQAYYFATRAALSGWRPPAAGGNAVRFWQERVQARPSFDEDSQFNDVLIRVLACMDR